MIPSFSMKGESMKKEEKFKKSIEEFVESLCDYCGIDKNDSNIKETPDRLYRMYKNELLKGYFNNPKDYLKTFDGISISEQPVVIEGIPVKSLCSHHVLPFFGEATITIKYKDGAKVLGLSKFYRIVDHFAIKLQLQEALTQEIAKFLYENLELSYIKVEIEAQHTCVGLRGVNVMGNKTKSIVCLGDE